MEGKDGRPFRSGDTYEYVEYFDGYRICLNGHVVAARELKDAAGKHKFCPSCGAETITHCPNCQRRIASGYSAAGSSHFRAYKRPNYCTECGEEFPWQKSGLEQLREIIEESNYDARKKSKLLASIEDIARDTPRTPGAMEKVLDFMKSLAPDAKGIVIKAVETIATETAKSLLK